MKEYANRALLKIEGQIRITSTQAEIRYFLSHHISEFLKNHRRVTFDVEGGNRDYILTSIESGDTDFGILNRDSVSKEFVYRDLFKTKFVLIASKNAHYTVEDLCTLGQIATLPFISIPKSSTLTPWIEKRFSQAGLKLNSVVILNNYENTKKYVGLGIGVSIIDDYMLTQEDKEKLDVFPLDQFFKARRFGITLRKRKYLSPAVKTFLKTIMPGSPVDLF